MKWQERRYYELSNKHHTAWGLQWFRFDLEMSISDRLKASIRKMVKEG